MTTRTTRPKATPRMRTKSRKTTTTTTTIPAVSTAATGAASHRRAATIPQTARSRGATLTHTWDRCTSRVYLRERVYLSIRPRREERSFTSTRSLPSSLRAPSDLVWSRKSSKLPRNSPPETARGGSRYRDCTTSWQTIMDGTEYKSTTGNLCTSELCAL